MTRTQPVADGGPGPGGRFLFRLPAYTLGSLAPAADGTGSSPAAVMPRCPEYGPYVALFTDLDLATRALGRLRAPRKVILELPTLAVVLDLLEAHAKGFGITHAGVDVSPLRAGTFGLFAPVRSFIRALRSGQPPVSVVHPPDGIADRAGPAESCGRHRTWPG